MSEVTSAVAGVMTTLTTQINVANIIGLVATGLGIAVGFMLAWFGVRKLIRIITTAMQNGKVKV